MRVLRMQDEKDDVDLPVYIACKGTASWNVQNLFIDCFPGIIAEENQGSELPEDLVYWSDLQSYYVQENFQSHINAKRRSKQYIDTESGILPSFISCLSSVSGSIGGVTLKRFHNHIEYHSLLIMEPNEKGEK